MKIEEILQSDTTEYYEIYLYLNQDEEKYLDAALSKIQRCQYFTLYSSSLKTLPHSFTSIKGIKRLSLQTSVLEALPEQWHWEELHELKLYSQQLKCISPALLNLPSLRWLEISGLPVKTLPFCKTEDSQLYYLELKLPNLKDLPEELCYFPLQSIYFHLPSMKCLPDIIGKLPHLRTLRIEAPLEYWPCDWQQATNLKSIQLTRTALKDLSSPDNFPQEIVSIYLTDNEKLLHWPSFFSYPQLQNVGLQRQPQPSLPDSLKDCPSLEYLNVVQMPLEKFPEVVTHLPKLKSLSLDNTNIKEIPDYINSLQNLEALSLRNNHLTEFPQIGHLSGHIKLNIDGNPWQHFYWLLQPKLPEVINTIDKRLQFPQEELLKLCKALAKSQLSTEDQQWFFDQIAFKPAIETETWELLRLYQGLTIAYKPLRDHLQVWLHQLTEKTDLNTSLQADSLVYVAGKTNLSKNEIRDKLKEVGLQYSPKLTRQVTHVLLGMNPKEYGLLAKKQYILLTENQLQTYLNEHKPQFLIEEEVTGTSQMSENVSMLLTSEDPANVLVAIEMLKSGGVPPSLYEDLLLAQKTCADSKARAEAKKLLQNHGPAEWLPLLSDQQSFANIAKMKERDIRNKLQKIAKSCGPDTAAFLSLLIFKHHQKGMQFVLSKFSPGNPWRAKAIDMLIQDGYLDFHAGIGYHNWKHTAPDDVILSYVKTGIKFPSDVPDACVITSINFHNCKMDSLSKDIGSFTELKTLDLSANYLKALPVALKKCKTLESLDLSHNRFNEFPEILAELPNLKQLNLQHNKVQGSWHPLTVPDWFKEALPACEVCF